MRNGTLSIMKIHVCLQQGSSNRSPPRFSRRRRCRPLWSRNRWQDDRSERGERPERPEGPERPEMRQPDAGVGHSAKHSGQATQRSDGTPGAPVRRWIPPGPEGRPAAAPPRRCRAARCARRPGVLCGEQPPDYPDPDRFRARSLRCGTPSEKSHALTTPTTKPERLHERDSATKR